jgi:outer membrane autotransporter protein
LNLNNEINGGFSFTGGTLQLATINVQTHNPAPDFDASTRIVLTADTFINTSFPDSTLTTAGTLTDNGAGFSVTAPGPGTVTLAGPVSSWTINGGFSVSRLSGGSAIIRDGAKLSDSFGFVSFGTVTVIGPGSAWTNSGDLQMGVHFIHDVFPGTLRIQDGGKVSDVNANITSGAVIVEGTGSTWINSGTLSIGVAFFRFPDTVLLRITSGGTVSAASTAILSTGTLEIGGSFTLNGPLTIDGGTVRAITDTTLPNDTKIDFGGGVFDSGGFNLIVSGNVSGPGGITKISPGTLVLAGNNTYSGTTNLAAGMLRAGSTTAFSPNSAFDVAATLDLNGFSNTIGSLSGAGIVTNNGAEPAILTAGNDNTNTIFSGTIQDGTSVLSLTKIGSGTWMLTGSNTYSGGTTISAGTLQIGNGGTTGNIIGNVTDNGTLAFNRNGDNKNFSGMISGSGNLVKLGSDTLVLTADNTYSGGTTIQDGILVAGAPNLAQTTSFALGAGDVFLLGGILRTPSLDPLTINVGRNYQQGPDGTLVLGVAGVAGRDYDHVQVGGNASLSGILAVSSLDSFRPDKGNAFEVLRSNGTRSGQFAQINDSLNNNPNLQRIDVYAPNGLALVYVGAAHPGSSPPPIEAVIRTPLPPVNPDEPLLPSFLVTALNPTAEQLTSVFEVPFSGANTQRFNLNDRMTQIQRGSTGFVSAVPTSQPTGNETGFQKDGNTSSPVFQPTAENHWGVWVNGWGNWVSVDNNDSAKGYDFTTGGVTVGLDYRVTEHIAVGGFGTYSHSWTSFNPGDADVNSGGGGLYATYWNQGFYVNTGIYGGGNGYDTRRQTLFQGQFASGNTSGSEFSTFVDTGYNFHFGDLSFGPVFAAQYTYVQIDGYSEHGGFLPLNIHGDSEESWRTDLGLQAYKTLHIGKITFIPSLWAAWEHEYKYSRLPITFSVAGFPGATATTFGPDIGHDSFIINAGGVVQWTPRISTYVGYQGQLGRTNYTASGVTGTISFSF